MVFTQKTFTRINHSLTANIIIHNIRSFFVFEFIKFIYYNKTCRKLCDGNVKFWYQWIIITMYC